MRFSGPLPRLHDRKMCIIGLSVLMELPSRPAVLEGVAAQIVPSILLLFLGLKHLYASRLVNKPDLLARAGAQDEDQNGENGSGKEHTTRTFCRTAAEELMQTKDVEKAERRKEIGLLMIMKCDSPFLPTFNLPLLES